MLRRLVLVLALLTTTLVSVAAQPRAEVPAQRRFEVRTTPEMRRHSRTLYALYFAGTAYTFAVLLLILQLGWSRRLRQWAMRIGRRRFVAGGVFFVLLSLVTTTLEFPLSFYAGYFVPHEFALTRQSFPSWLADFAKGIGVEIAIGSVVAALVLLAMRLYRRWWLAVWLGSIPFILAGFVIWPLFIDPLFNDFVPLKDPVLRRALLDEAAKAGIEGSRVYQVNKSKQTNTMNAYMTGIGPSKRIVLWDTLLAKLDRDEILAVMGHEMGHYVLNHLWKGFFFGLLVAFAATFAGQRIYEWGVARWGGRWGIEERGDPAGLTWLLLVASMITFLLSPVSSAYSRHLEHEADVFGLELTHLNEADASSYVKFAEDAKLDPDPPAFIEWWLFSHPSTKKRIEFALQFKPGQGK